MNAGQPPPLTREESPWLAYLRFLVVTVPSIVCFSFTSILLFPKVAVIWEAAGLDKTRAAWMVHTLQSLTLAFYPLAGLVILLVVFLELSRMRRFRSGVLSVVAGIISCFVLATTTMTSLTVLLATPVLIEGKKEKPDYERYRTPVVR